VDKLIGGLAVTNHGDPPQLLALLEKVRLIAPQHPTRRYHEKARGEQVAKDH